MTEFELAAAARLMFTYLVWMTGMFVVATWRAAGQHRRLRLSTAVQPRIRDALIDYLSGREDQEALRGFNSASHRQIGEAIIGFEGTVSGAARDRLCDLSIELGLVHDWDREARSRDLDRRREAYSRLAFLCSYEPCRRIVGEGLLRGLEDPDREVRLASARAVLRSGFPSEIDTVFLMALTHSLLLRVLLAEDLRRHAATLCARAIPQGLESSDPRLVMATLDMLLAWERALPLTGIFRLLRDRGRAIRLKALRLAPLVSPEPETQAEVIRALADPDPEICRTGARSAGRMRLDQAIPLLARCLRLGTSEVARDAAFALAEMPPLGPQTLEELRSSGHAPTAAAASEALARVRPQAGPR